MSDSFPDYYRVLEVDRRASSEALKQAYLRLMRFYYPDFNLGRPAPAQQFALEKTKALNEAWEWLSERRVAYDELLNEWEREEITAKARALGIIPDTVEAPPPPPPPLAPNRQGRETDIADLIQIAGFEVVDKRQIGGALWVVGGREHKAYFDEWRKKGYDFVHGSGGKSTRNRPAWWLRPTTQ